jgi:hypothetical protein
VLRSSWAGVASCFPLQQYPAMHVTHYSCKWIVCVKGLLQLMLWLMLINL